MAFFRGVLQALSKMVDKAWVVLAHYARTEALIKDNPQMSKEEQDKIRVDYDREQIDLELSFECAANLLWFFVESEAGGQPAASLAACKEEALSVMHRVVTTPLVASACSSMFHVFIDALLQLLDAYGFQEKARFMTQTLARIDRQADNLARLVAGKPFQQVVDIEVEAVRCADLVLSEEDAEEEHLRVLAELREHDQASVVFGKLAFYAEIVQRNQGLSKNEVLAEPAFLATTAKIFRIQAMINRYHAAKYQKDLLKEQARLDALINKYPE